MITGKELRITHLSSREGDGLPSLALYGLNIRGSPSGAGMDAAAAIATFSRAFGQYLSQRKAPDGHICVRFTSTRRRSQAFPRGPGTALAAL